MMTAAAFDAIYSLRHLAVVGLGDSVWSMLLRLLATAGPVRGTIALAWAWWLVRRRQPAPPRVSTA